MKNPRVFAKATGFTRRRQVFCVSSWASSELADWSTVVLDAGCWSARGPSAASRFAPVLPFSRSPVLLVSLSPCLLVLSPDLPNRGGTADGGNCLDALDHRLTRDRATSILPVYGLLYSTYFWTLWISPPRARRKWGKRRQDAESRSAHHSQNSALGPPPPPAFPSWIA
jgi:hypothetical protein